MVVSNDFKNKIKKMGRQFDVLIAYPTMYKLITEDDRLIITQDSMKILTEQMSNVYDNFINGEHIKRLVRDNLGELFKTYMKSFDVETTEELFVGQNIQVSLGVKEEQDEEYTYLDYGTFYVYQKAYNEDTKTYTYTICDKMMFTMIPFKLEYIIHENETQVTIQNAITRILNECGIDNADIELTDIVNGDKVIYKETFEQLELTCRDVLDMIMQTTGSSLVVYDTNNAVKFTYRTISNQAVETIDEDILSNKNLSFTKKFGKINSLLFSRASGTDNIERKDTEDISVNGYCQYVIENNFIIDQENRADFIDDLFDAIKDTEYYVCEIDCTGLAYIEYLDKFNVTAQGNTYNCVCLKNTFTLENGFSEEFKSEEPQQIKQDYTQGGKDDKTASILLDKLKGEIVLKTDNDGKVTKVRLDSSGDSGSLIEIGADNIKLEGYTTINDGFSVDLQGNMVATSGLVGGWNISNQALYKDVTIGNYDYRVFIQAPQEQYGEDTWVFSTQRKLTSQENFYGTSKIDLGGTCDFLYGYIEQNLYVGLNDSTKGNIICNRVVPKYDIYYLDDNGDITSHYGPSQAWVEGSITSTGNLYCYGNFTCTGSKNRVVNVDGKKVLMNAYETTTPYFGDIGTDKTDAKGICKIEIDKTFKQTIEEDDYKVFVQKLGEGDLYVKKYKDYFEVIGTPDLEFDYEIKAIQKGYKNVRMEEFKEEQPNREIENLEGGNK